jgi:putative phosphoesterase
MIALISDIHGNYPALMSVVKELKRWSPEVIVCLGDIAGYYSQINECCDLLRELDVISVRGNHDHYLVGNVECPSSRSANRCLAYQRQVISKENFQWLSSFPTESTVDGISVRHAGWLDPLEERLDPCADYLEALPWRRLASGHSHFPCLVNCSGKQYCNPGSVGQPRDGDFRASFAIWDENDIAIIRVAYDFARTQKEMAKAGFDDYFFRNLEFGIAIGATR